jgi:hypothetical protein
MNLFESPTNSILNDFSSLEKVLFHANRNLGEDIYIDFNTVSLIEVNIGMNDLVG